MKLRKLFSILGLGAVFALAGACGQNTADNGVQTQENVEAQEEIQAEPEEGAEAAADGEAVQGQQEGEAAADAPLRIYGAITEVGEDTITVDNQSGNSSAGEMILTIDPESTVLVDAQTGLPLSLTDVTTGSFEAYLGPVMTMSLPPQTTPYVVIANIPEDGSAPQYAVAAEELALEDGVYTLKATDGKTYAIPEDVEILPFRTRNIVTLADLTAGRGALIWLDENETVVKVVLLEGTPGAEETVSDGGETETVQE